VFFIVSFPGFTPYRKDGVYYEYLDSKGSDARLV